VDYKNDANALPSLNELKDGLMGWYVPQIESNMKNKSKNMHMGVIKRTRHEFKEIFDSINISDWNKPMTHSKADTELGLTNPYSKISCFIVNLYSMEFGNPQFYSVVNKAAREMDLTNLKYLGPFVRALSVITANAEMWKQDDD